MLKQTMKLWVAVVALGLAAPAQAMTFDLGIEVTFASGGNPIGAALGITPAAGVANIGSQTTPGPGSGFQDRSVNADFDPAADLALTIGTILFGDEDDIEGFLDSGVPAMVFQDGVFQGLDFVILFEISGGQAIGKDFDSSDLSLLTDMPDPLAQFTDTQHYWADFSDDGSFLIGTVAGFDQFFDAEDMANFVGPTIGEILVTGNVFVPEPSLAMLVGVGLVGFAVMRRR